MKMAFQSMITSLERVVAPFPVPDKENKEDTESHIMNIGEDVVEIGHLEGARVYW